MGLVIIFGITAIVGAFALVDAFKKKNKLGIAFALLTALIFGWFAVMTVINSGYPAQIH